MSRLPLDAETLYRRLPIGLQQLACSAVGWRTERTRYGKGFPELLEDLSGRTYWSHDELTSFRDRRLRETLLYSQRWIPHYRDSWRMLGLDPGSVETSSDLEGLPLLTKMDAQEVGSRLWSTDDRLRTRIAHTSGTTGGALRFPITLQSTQAQWATWWRFRLWHGLERGTPCGLFAGRSVVPAEQQKPPFWRRNAPGRQVLFSGYHMSEANLPQYVAALRRYQLPWLHGYPSHLAVLASFVLDHSVDLGYAPRWITTGAENLMPQQAQLMADAFGVRPVQHYGSAEAAANISECELGALHVDEDFSCVEFMPTDAAGQYRIVGTSFVNLATVFVRYETQDLASVAIGASCACGRRGRVVETVDGRLEDYVILANGARIGRMDHVFKDMVNVREAQIRQRRPGALTVLVVPRSSYGAKDEHDLIREMRKRVGDETVVEIEYVSALQRSPVGKLRFVVSEMTN